MSIFPAIRYGAFSKTILSNSDSQLYSHFNFKSIVFRISDSWLYWFFNSKITTYIHSSRHHAWVVYMYIWIYKFENLCVTMVTFVTNITYSDHAGLHNEDIKIILLLCNEIWNFHIIRMCMNYLEADKVYNICIVNKDNIMCNFCIYVYTYVTTFTYPVLCTYIYNVCWIVFH